MKITITDAYGNQIELDVSRDIALFIRENDRYMELLGEIDRRQFRILHFDKRAWENMHNLSTGYSAEDEYLNIPEEKVKAEEAWYQKRLNQYREFLPAIQAACTETQWRRFFLHSACGLTTREIAQMEGCNQRAVCKSITGVRKKIKKILPI